jgi:hypothetical protein
MRTARYAARICQSAHRRKRHQREKGDFDFLVPEDPAGKHCHNEHLCPLLIKAYAIA